MPTFVTASILNHGSTRMNTDLVDPSASISAHPRFSIEGFPDSTEQIPRNRVSPTNLPS